MHFTRHAFQSALHMPAFRACCSAGVVAGFDMAADCVIDSPPLLLPLDSAHTHTPYMLRLQAWRPALTRTRK